MTQAQRHIPCMVPEALREKAVALAATAWHRWTNSLFWQAILRDPQLGDFGQRREWIGFLREWSVLTFGMSDDNFVYAAHPAERSGSPSDCRLALDDDAILSFAWPLFRGEWGGRDRDSWLAVLADLVVGDLSGRDATVTYTIILDRVWRVIGATPGALRPRRPKRCQTRLEFDDALDAAVRWFDEQEARASRQARRRPALAGLLEEKVPAAPPADDESANGPTTGQTSPAPAAAAENERNFMELAINEARKSVGEDGRAHPKVGAVVVKGGIVLASAHRGELGKGDHAEYTALERKLADDSVAGATVYTTLEPCTTRKLPKIPCAERLIKRKVKRVVIGMLDPNPAIRGNGVLLLREHNIEVALFQPDLMAVLEELNRDFSSAHSHATSGK
jgi:pyrimidine deaminase RibD-like protein